MGVSTDALLLYGIEVKNEDGDNGDLSKEDLAKFFGIPEEEVEMSEDSVLELIENLLEDSPLELSRHCHYDYPMCILHLKAHRHRAWRGEPVKLDKDTLFVAPVDNEEARAWCEPRGIAWAPDWILASNWS